MVARLHALLDPLQDDPLAAVRSAQIALQGHKIEVSPLNRH